MEGEVWLIARFWFSVAAFVVSGGAAVYAYWAGRDRLRRQDVDERIGDLEDRVTRVERDQYHAPTHKDLGDLYDRLNDTNRALSELTGKLGTLSTSLERIEGFLLNHGRGSS